MHSACHVSIFVFWSGVRLSVARLTHAIESAFETPLAQHALSPANALDAVSIATATRAVVVILIMVKPQTGVVQGLFNLFSYRDPSLFILIPQSREKNLGSLPFGSSQ
jgi:hypothetical protein